jgi:hypothetical protein
MLRVRLIVVSQYPPRQAVSLSLSPALLKLQSNGEKPCAASTYEGHSTAERTG